MKFKQKTIRSFLIFLVVISTLIITGMAIYYFGFQAIKSNDFNQQEKTQPTFAQTEINWISKDKSLILSRFCQLLEAKRPETKFSYAVDNLDFPSRIKVSYFFNKQEVNWFYELQFPES